MQAKLLLIQASEKLYLELQRRSAVAPGLVADGRDMGSVVFPEARLKIFLTASAESRAKRRYNQLKEKGISSNIDDLVSDLKDRDRRDMERSVAPLKPGRGRANPRFVRPYSAGNDRSGSRLVPREQGLKKPLYRAPDAHPVVGNF